MPRLIPSPMDTMIASGVMCLAWVFVVTRADGTVFGFTDHDRPLTVDGVPCEPESGFDPSTYDGTLGATTDGMDLLGAVDSTRITRPDVEAGLWDDAGVRILLVDWRDPSVFVTVCNQTISEITLEGSSFRAQMRSALADFADEGGQLLEHDCQWVLGDARCGVDLGAFEFAAVAGGVGPDWIEATAFGARHDGYFDGGLVTFPSGAVAGILTHEGVRVTFVEPLSVAAAQGDALTVTPGCNKIPATCRGTFSNFDNYGGFPFMVGSDGLIQVGAYAGREGGASQFSYPGEE